MKLLISTKHTKTDLKTLHKPSLPGFIEVQVFKQRSHGRKKFNRTNNKIQMDYSTALDM